MVLTASLFLNFCVLVLFQSLAFLSKTMRISIAKV